MFVYVYNKSYIYTFLRNNQGEKESNRKGNHKEQWEVDDE